MTGSRWEKMISGRRANSKHWNTWRWSRHRHQHPYICSFFRVVVSPLFSVCVSDFMPANSSVCWPGTQQGDIRVFLSHLKKLFVRKAIQVATTFLAATRSGAASPARKRLRVCTFEILSKRVFRTPSEGERHIISASMLWCLDWVGDWLTFLPTRSPTDYW